MNEYTPKEVAAIDTPRQLCRLRFSLDGELLIGGGYDAMIRRWKVDGDELHEIAPIEGFHGWVQTFVMHPVEPLIFAADTWGRLACYAYAEESPSPKWELAEAHDGWIRSLAIISNGTRLASVGNDRVARVFEAANGKILHEFKVSEHDIFAVTLTDDAKTVVTGDLFGRIKAFDAASGDCIREFDGAKLHYYDRDQDVCGIRSLGFEDGGKTLVCAGAEPTKAGRGHGVPVIYRFDFETGELKQRMEQGNDNDGFIDDLVTHPAGFYMSVTTGQPGKGKLILHRPDEEKPFAEYTKMANTHSIALHPDGKRFVVAATNRNSQGNGAVKDKEGNYRGNFSPLHLFEFPAQS